jgi:PAS domain S-box-containing protein
VAYYILIILFIGVVSNIIITVDMERELMWEYLEEGDREVMFIAQTAAEPLLTDDLVAIKKIIETVKTQDRNTVYVVITDSYNQPVVHTFEEGYPVELSKVFEKQQRRVVFYTESGEEITDFSEPILEGKYTVHVGLTKKNLSASVAETRGNIAALTILGMLLASLFSYLTGSLITRQLKTLRDGAERIRRGGYGYLLDERAFTGEFLNITQAFNRMSTEIQRKIEEIKQTRGQLETIINSANLGINVKDTNFKLLYVNRWIKEKLPPKGVHCYHAFWNRSEPCEGCPMKQTLESGELATMLREERIDGETRVFKLTAAPIKKDGDVIAIVEIIDDVTETHRLQQEITENRNYLENIINSLSDALLVIDENYTIVKANNAAAQLSGYDREALIGKKCYKVFHNNNAPCKPPEHFCPLEAVRETKQTQRVTHTHCRGGEKIYVEISATPLYEHGRLQMIEIMHDITNRVKMEQTILQKNRELEKLNRIAEIANQNLSKTELLNEVLKELVALTHTDIGSMHLLSDSKFQLAASVGISRKTAEDIKHFNIYDSIAGEVYHRKKSIIVENLSEDERVRIEAVKKSRITSFISIPLKVHNEILGVIALGSYKPHIFEQSEVNLLEAIANHTATALHRIQTHEAYKKAKEEYDELFESAIDGILTFNTSYRIQSINRAGVQLLKTEFRDIEAARRELIGSDLREYIPYDEREQLTEAVSKILTGQYTKYRNTFKFPAAEEKYYEYQINPVKKGTLLQAVIRDVSEQVQLRKTIEAEQEKYQSLVENAPVGVYILQDGVIKFANRALAEISGYSLTELGMPFADAVAEESRALVEEQVKLKLEGKPHLNKYEFKLKRKDGEIRHVEVHPTVITYEGRPAILGSILDITERKKLEEELMNSLRKLNIAYAELEKLNALRTDFISNISHELKTPLTTIKGYSELLYDETFGKLNEKQKKNIEVVLRSSERLENLISDLIDISRIESRQLKLEPKPTNLKDLTEKVAEELKTNADKKGLYIKTHIPQNITINVDPTRFAQAISNLLSNAIKFTEKGGITINATKKEENIHITISDTGIGIPEEHLPHIFDRFYQADSSIRRRFGGAGLGLAITKSIIEAHKGIIWAESETDKGTTFHIII